MPYPGAVRASQIASVGALMLLSAPPASWAGDLSGAEPNGPSTEMPPSIIDAWLATDPQQRLESRNQYLQPDSILSASFREGEKDHAQDLRQPDLYLVEAAWDPIDHRLSIRQAVTHTHTGSRPENDLVLRMFAAGGAADSNTEPSDYGISSQVTLRPVHVDGAVVHTSTRGTLLYVHLAEPMRPGDTVTVTLNLEQDVPEIPPPSTDQVTPFTTGVYGYRGDLVNLGYWLPQLTAYTHDGWDTRPVPSTGEHKFFEPALFHVALDLPADVTVATTGVEIDTQRIEKNRTRHRFVASDAREFAVHFSNRYRIHELDGDPDAGTTRVRVFYDHTASKAEEGELAARRVALHATKALAFFDDWLGQTPLAELDLVLSTGNFAMGTEYPGLVTLNLNVIDGFGSDPGLTVAHEVAHQWWYSEVGNDSIAEPWVDEALTSYSAARYWEHRYGAQAMLDELRRPVHEARLRGDTVPTPATLPSSQYNSGDFGPIIYGRAPLFFHTVREDIGDAAFTSALRAYLRRYRHSFATGDDLVRILRAASDDPRTVDMQYRKWILGFSPNQIIDDAAEISPR